jgi:hypothetical protein
MIIMIVKILVLRANSEIKQQVYAKIVTQDVLDVFLLEVPRIALLAIQQHFFTAQFVI